MIASQKAFTTPYPGITNAIVSEALVFEAFNMPKTPLPTGLKFHAIWDTGATGTVITQKIVDKLGLKPIGRIKVSTAAGPTTSAVYKINIGLPNGIMFQQLRVTLGIITDKIDLLIGMDIICSGDFAITNKGGKTTFTFSVPSTRNIDFVKEIKASNAKVKLTVPAPINLPSKEKPQRNEKCWCKSGKKYKKCHMNSDLNNPPN